MEQQKKPLAILNLTGEFIPELREYFGSRSILVIDPLTSSIEEDWTHIITKDVHDFDLLNKTYELTKNNRHIISLSKIDDLQNFTINNGNMVLDDCWFKGPMGPFIMDKYFQGYGGITLGENYPAFKEQGSFNIANPFNTGEYLDRLIQNAFESGIEALTVKTYFDHLIMYLAGLKKKDKAGFPFEVTYGAFEDIFAVQIHFFCQKLTLLDVTSSLAGTPSKKAEEYFLNTAVQSSDFFDFSYMPEVNKVIVTGLWTRDERIKFENRGLMFMALTGGVALAQYQGEGASSLFMNNSSLTDFTDKVSIPDSRPEDFLKNVLDGHDFSKDSTRVSGGLPDLENFFSLIDGTDETDDEALLIKGEKELDELIQNIRGKFEEDTTVMRISGSGKLDIDEVAFKIASSVDLSAKDNSLKVRSLGNKLPDKIKTGLFDFAKNLEKDVDDLSDADIDNFQIQKMPEIIQQSLVTQINRAAEARASAKMGGTLAGEFNRDMENNLQIANVENEKLRSQMKALMTEVRILKESRAKLAAVKMKAAQAASEVASKQHDDQGESLRKHFQVQLQEQKALNADDQRKLAALLENESKLIAESKQEEIKAKKMQIESLKKETYFSQELEKSLHQVKAKDLLLMKTKESFTKLVEKKESEVREMKAKVDQLSKALTNGPAAAQTQTIKDLEKQNQNLNKQLEVYKIKITSLATNMQANKSEDNFKDEARKLQMMNQQMKNQLDASRKEIEKLQAKSASDNSHLLLMKQDKTKLENLLKKATMDERETAAAVPTPAQININDQDMRRLQAQNQILETQVKETMSKIATLETKLAEAQKPQRTVSNGDEGSKVKVSQLENSVKKLTQDLVESRNSVADIKKETNKLRQEKTALQNQIDKMKKEADKARPVSPKKPGGKAA
jgi:hypothetical protein